MYKLLMHEKNKSTWQVTIKIQHWKFFFFFFISISELKIQHKPICQQNCQMTRHNPVSFYVKKIETLDYICHQVKVSWVNKGSCSTAMMKSIFQHKIFLGLQSSAEAYNYRVRLGPADYTILHTIWIYLNVAPTPPLLHKNVSTEW